MKKKIHFSPSFLIGFDACPYKQLTETFSSNVYTVFGDAVHDIAERYSEGTLNLDEIDVNQMLQDTDAMNEAKGIDIKINTSKFRTKLKNIIEHLPDFNMPDHDIVDIESKNAPSKHRECFFGKTFLTVPIMSGPIYLRGRIDIIFENEEEIVICDWKTGKSLAPELQTIAYSIMTCLSRGIMPEDKTIKVRFNYLESGKVVEQIVTSEKLEFYYEKIKDIIAEYYKQIELDEYSKKPSFNTCRFCKCPCYVGRSFQSNFGPSKTVSGY